MVRERRQASTEGGFSLCPDGKAFLTSVLAVKGDIWLLQDFNRRIGWLDRLRRKP